MGIKYLEKMIETFESVENKKDFSDFNNKFLDNYFKLPDEFKEFIVIQQLSGNYGWQVVIKFDNGAGVSIVRNDCTEGLIEISSVIFKNINDFENFYDVDFVGKVYYENEISEFINIVKNWDDEFILKQRSKLRRKEEELELIEAIKQVIPENNHVVEELRKIGVSFKDLKPGEFKEGPLNRSPQAIYKSYKKKIDDTKDMVDVYTFEQNIRDINYTELAVKRKTFITHRRMGL